MNRSKKIFWIGLLPLALLLLLALTVQSLPTEPTKNEAVARGSTRSSKVRERLLNVDFADLTECDAEKCKLPTCHCGSTKAPYDLALSETPQIFMISFGDGINDANYEMYQRIFDGKRKNPNGCPIRGTFFVSHEWTDYSLVQNLYQQGHEIASQTISRPTMDVANVTDMLLEIDGQREILAKFANIPSSDIRGMRAPSLHPAGDAQFEALWKKAYLYDSSLTVVEYGPPLFPYTLDYALPHRCNIWPCPTKSFPGLWEVPLVAWRDLSDLPCSVADACVNLGNTTEEMYSFFQKNFDRHYNSNRAPISAYFHSGWFSNDYEFRLQAFLKFLDDTISKHKDVWFVSAADTVMWMKTGVPLDRINKLKPWQCDVERKLSRKSKRTTLPSTCESPNTCRSKFREYERYWKTCAKCPEGETTTLYDTALLSGCHSKFLD